MTKRSTASSMAAPGTGSGHRRCQARRLWSVLVDSPQQARTATSPWSWSGDRGRRTGRQPVDGPWRQGGGRRRGGQRHAHRAPDGDHGRRRGHRRGREGQRAHALQRGEHRRRLAAQTDIAVDPIDGTTPIALGVGGHWRSSPSPSAAHVRPRPCVYMEKIAVGPRGKGSIDIEVSAPENLESLAKALGRPVRDLTAVILDRPRHEELIAQVRQAGARIRLITDGDVAGALATVRADISGADVLFGIGGTPEGVLAGRSLKCVGGEIQGRLWPRNDDERAARRRRRLRHRRRAPHRRPRLGRQRLLRGDRHHRRRPPPGVRYLDFAPPPSPWCCARARGRCGRSTPSTRSPSWPSTASCTESP